MPPSFDEPTRSGPRGLAPARRARLAAGGLGFALVWLIGLSSGVTRGATMTVAATNYVFGPDVVTIALGDTVAWTFAGEPHTITSGTVTAGVPHPDGLFDSGIRLPGQAYALGPGGDVDPFTVPGRYPFYCAVHAEQMTGTIIVEAAATGAPGTTAGAGGTASTTGQATSDAPAGTAPAGTAPATPGAAPAPTPSAAGSGGAQGPGGAAVLIGGLAGLGVLGVAGWLLVRRARSG